MAFLEDPAIPQQIPSDLTDSEAAMLLPPFPIVLRHYRTLRKQNVSPAAALLQTLQIWREIVSDARPPYRRPTTTDPIALGEQRP